MLSIDPSSAALLLERWFHRHQRRLPWREDYEPYQVWVSEVMLQQTRMEVVLPYFERFLRLFPSVGALAAAAEPEVLAAWSGLGYYRRARMLHQGARAVVERFGGNIPSSVDALLELPGVGRYTAGAIASVAWRQRTPIVDGNVARVVARLWAIEHPSASPALMREAWSRATALVEGCDDPRALNQGLMELGALICRPRAPLCLVCPLQSVCAANATGRAGELPRPKLVAATHALRIPLYLVRDAAGRVLMRKENGPLMTGMFHLPHGNTSLFGGQPLAVIAGDLLGAFRHTVTTRKIAFELYAAELPSRISESHGEYAWIHPDALESVPHPSYVRKALRLAASGTISTRNP